ncbi:mannitol-1-phosphate 5-dehydrogenase [Aquibacillus saliphilus]|uniref:mannitol-1-phosphate 5-dehydrogenase n=1 Tax=Aquibacillus saliphilus TaxID=1909422 RepID=UPI001CEFFF1E|nr:mannitol-1-phosphate 5-dehydrogenase [Aquibacillus saliphilus]
MFAVHFGAGNIGRGFIGALLYKSGYTTQFVDVNKNIIDELNEKRQYKVVLADQFKEEFLVENVSGINSVDNPEKVIEAIVKADIITTAVGPNILPIIAEIIAKGLSQRKSVTDQPLTIIACENMIGGSSLLKEKVLEHVTDQEKAEFVKLYGFPDSAVDRIVPNQVNEDPLTVSVEPYYEWVVEDTDVKGSKPPIDGITYVNDLAPYIERKLFTVNTGHAVVAYLGRHFGYKTIKEAMDSDRIKGWTKAALSESGEALIQMYHFDRENHENYITKILNRFVNPYISDEVTRVGRGPIRKLGGNDRLIRPASLYLEKVDKEPIYLAKAIAAALLYRFDEDEEAVSLQQTIKNKGYQQTLQTISGLSLDHPLMPIIINQLKELKK